MAAVVGHHGAVAASPALAETWSKTLAEQLARLQALGDRQQLWHYWDLHNPWSRAADAVDSWQVLDICQAPELLSLVCQWLGEDIILFDSQLLPNPRLAEPDAGWRSDADFFPLSSGTGLCVRLPCGAGHYSFTYRESSSGLASVLEPSPGELVLHRGDLSYRSHDDGHHPFEFVIRYFPASAQYLRDPADARHLRLMESYPWINYVTKPLWLVHGEDHGDNDFATGFQPKTGRWTHARSSLSD